MRKRATPPPKGRERKRRRKRGGKERGRIRESRLVQTNPRTEDFPVGSDREQKQRRKHDGVLDRNGVDRPTEHGPARYALSRERTALPLGVNLRRSPRLPSIIDAWYPQVEVVKDSSRAEG